MAELREIQFEDEPIVLSEVKSSEKDGNSMSILVPWIQSDKKNQNGRTYPLALLQREVAKIQSSVKKGAFVGAGDHPLTGIADVATASHIVKGVWLDKKGKGWAEMKVIPTDRGNNVMTLIDQGAQLGVSARGFGSVDDKTGEVQNDYKLAGIDIVTNPSYKEGVFDKKNVFESLNFELSDKNKVEDELNEDLSSKNKTDIGVDKMKIEELKEKYPELVKQIEDEKAAALKAEADKVAGDEDKDGKITELDGKVKTLEDEKKAAEEEIKGLKEKAKKFVEFLRNHISDIGELPDVLEGGEVDPNAEPEPEPKETDKELESDLADAKGKIEALETKNKEREDDAKKATKAEELQTALEPALAEILEKEEYVPYANLIRKGVTDEDGKITIESVEAVEDAVKAEFDRVSEIRSAEVKKQIIKDTEEKGNVDDPEGGNEKEQKAKLVTYYREAIAGGFKGTYDEWKEKFPRIVESVE